MAANTIPTVSTLPPAPTRADAPADFTTKADAFVASLPPLVTQVNLTVKGMNDQASYLDQLKTDTIKATGDNATAAANSAKSASDSAAASSTSANQASGFRDSAQAAAAAAQSSAGLPAISGKADFMLSVNAAGNGVEWRPSIPRPTSALVGKVPRVNSAGNGYELADGSPVSKYFESTPQSLLSAAKTSITHGLGNTPKSVTAYLVCTAANNGFAVGDKIEVPTAVAMFIDNSGNAYLVGFSLVTDQSSIGIIFTNYGPLIPTNPPVANQNPRFSTADRASWKLVVRALA